MIITKLRLWTLASIRDLASISNIEQRPPSFYLKEACIQERLLDEEIWYKPGDPYSNIHKCARSQFTQYSSIDTWICTFYIVLCKLLHC